MSKRIFTDRSDPPPSTELGRTPICYYHKQPITHFCVKKKCTLPLCQDCLPIHKRQHINDKQIPMEGIIQFQKAKQECLDAFSDRKKQIEDLQQKFKGKILEYRSKFIQIVDSILDAFFEDCLITDGNIEIIKQIQQRTSDIRAGSLKELIRYYQDTYGAQHFRKLYKMYHGQYLTHFKFQINKRKIQQLVNGGITNLALKDQNNKLVQPQVKVSIKNQVGQKIEIKEHNQSNSNMPLHHHHPIFHNKQAMVEEEQQSQIQSYKLLKSKKGSNWYNQPNIYTQQMGKANLPLSSIPSSNNSNVSKSKSKKKKGLSLTRPQAPFAFKSEPSVRSQDERSQQNNQKRQNWRYFVNMGETNPNQKSVERLKESRLAVQMQEPKTLLNPRQMRELILRKKAQEKVRWDKQLKTNKSTGPNMPVSQDNGTF